jgi:hypothetical protein
MNFLLEYQRRLLPSPLNIQDFDESDWTREFERLGSDDVDADLHRAGLMVRRKCSPLWSMRYLLDARLNTVTKVRVTLALSNHAAHSIVRLMKSHFADEHEAGQPLVPLIDLGLDR